MSESVSTSHAKLALVRSHGQSIARSSVPLITAGDQLNTLHMRLQTTLNTEKLLSLFYQTLSESLLITSLHFDCDSLSYHLHPQQRQTHCCHYQLQINAFWLGELSLTRDISFSDDDTQFIENCISQLVYPLRNSLLYQKACQLNPSLD